MRAAHGKTSKMFAKSTPDWEPESASSSSALRPRDCWILEDNDDRMERIRRLAVSMANERARAVSPLQVQHLRHCSPCEGVGTQPNKAHIAYAAPIKTYVRFTSVSGCPLLCQKHIDVLKR